jgi:hypothetical protein
MRRLIALLLVAILATPASAVAQSAQEAQATQQTQAPPVDVSKMGVSLSRIKRELAEPPAEQTADDSPLRMSFRVEVVGSAPKIDFLEGFPVNGPMPYGAPTHQEVLDVLTPQAYRSPVFPIYGLAAVAAQKLWHMNKKRRCEAELEEYRRLVMQGVPVAAPRCAQ